MKNNAKTKISLVSILVILGVAARMMRVIHRHQIREQYSLWWILIQRDWYLYQGNLDYLKEQKGHLCDLLQLIMTRIGEDGLEKFNDNEGRFLDWPSCENPLYTKSFH